MTISSSRLSYGLERKKVSTYSLIDSVFEHLLWTKYSGGQLETEEKREVTLSPLDSTYLILKSSAASLALSIWLISLAFSALLHRI